MVNVKIEVYERSGLTSRKSLIYTKLRHLPQQGGDSILSSNKKIQIIDFEVFIYANRCSHRECEHVFYQLFLFQWIQLFIN